MGNLCGQARLGWGRAEFEIEERGGMGRIRMIDEDDPHIAALLILSWLCLKMGNTALQYIYAIFLKTCCMTLSNGWINNLMNKC